MAPEAGTSAGVADTTPWTRGEVADPTSCAGGGQSVFGGQGFSQCTGTVPAEFGGGRCGVSCSDEDTVPSGPVLATPPNPLYSFGEHSQVQQHLGPASQCERWGVQTLSPHSGAPGRAAVATGGRCCACRLPLVFPALPPSRSVQAEVGTLVPLGLPQAAFLESEGCLGSDTP